MEQSEPGAVWLGFTLFAILSAPFEYIVPI